MRLYASYKKTDRDLESGDSTIPLNSEETKTLGMNVEYPLINSWLVGGNAEHERHEATVGPYRRNSAGVYLQIPKILKSTLRLFADKSMVDHLRSVEDVDLTRYGMRYHSRPWNRTN